MKVSDSLFLKKYRNGIIKAIKNINPDLPEDKIKEITEKMILERVKNPEVTLDNNYTGERRKTTLLPVLDWAINTKPIIAGNGTFYKQHSEGINPTADMVDNFLDQRKKYKKQMFAVGDESSPAYKDFDLKQQNEKVLANSYYGASGMPSSPFYSEWSGGATTLSAQSVISTCETTFESFIGNNFIFISFNECIEWINKVLQENVTLDDWIVPVTGKECYERISDLILDATEEDLLVLEKFINNLSQDEVTRLYYKNNIIEFTDRHEYVLNLNRSIFESIHNYEYMKDDDDIEVIPKNLREDFVNKKYPMKAWNEYVDKEYFYNPNDVPDSVKDIIEELKDIYMKYIYVQFLYIDRIYRLRNFKRSVVTVIDTDSNILSLDTWMDYCINTIMESDYGRSEENNVYIAVNTITYTLTSVVTDILLHYGEMSNVEESIRPRYNMKNEFFFSRLIIAQTKKRYLSKIVLREGNRLKKPKFDVKGLIYRSNTKKFVLQNLFNCWKLLLGH